jgi:hypothetical protein
MMGILFGLVWGGLVFAGGHRLEHLENYPLAMTGSIVALLPCNVCCLLGLPFGIWALIVLNDPDVRNAFRS